MRWKGKGDFCSDKYRAIYSDGELHERRVAIILDKEKETVYMSTGSYQIELL